jgi:mRNA interferase MazF
MKFELKKYDIYLVMLDPTRGSEQRGTRPCLVVQCNEANRFSNTTVICPFSSVIKYFPQMLIVHPSQSNGLSVQSRLDILQIRVVDQARFLRKIGILEMNYRKEFRERFTDSFDLDDLFE